MISQKPSLLAAFLIILSLKVLLLRAPHSTDLEVHRHWKALTYHKPLREWYTDESSIWTLDYPPLFAFLEFLLANLIAPFFPTLISLSHPSTHTETEVTVMRITQLLFEPLLFYAVCQFATSLPPKTRPKAILAALLLPGLTLVDNIHFQYNALPLSLLLLTLHHLSQGNLHVSAVLHSLTLNFKQTLLPLSPLIATYILANIYHSPRNNLQKLTTLTTLAITTLLSIVLPWLSFLQNGTYKQAFRRLFPLHRGLLHANWAANIWAPYATLDRLLTLLGLSSRVVRQSTTTGMIHNSRPFAVLPNPTPQVCILLTLAFSAPFMVSLFRRPSQSALVVATAATGLSSFLFGWHVHEKAVLVPLLPLALAEHHEAFIWLSLGGQFALLELLRDPTIAFFLIAHFVAFHAALFAIYGVSRVAASYFVGCLILEVYAGVLGGHRMLFEERMEFLPIMLVSLYSFVGVAVAYLKLLQKVVERGKTE